MVRANLATQNLLHSVRNQALCFFRRVASKLCHHSKIIRLWYPLAVRKPTCAPHDILPRFRFHSKPPWSLRSFEAWSSSATVHKERRIGGSRHRQIRRPSWRRRSFLGYVILWVALDFLESIAVRSGVQGLVSRVGENRQTVTIVRKLVRIPCLDLCTWLSGLASEGLKGMN